MSVEVAIEFSTMQNSLSLIEAFTAILEVLVKDSNKVDYMLKIPLSAVSAKPKLEFESSIDFGVMVSGLMASQPSKTPLSSKTISLRNTGPVGTTVKFSYNPAVLRVTPDFLNLGASRLVGMPATDSNECQVLVEFLRAPIGQYTESIILECNSLKPEKEPLSVSVFGSVVAHKLRLKNSTDTFDLDPHTLNFGAIYYSQMAQFTAMLENRGSTPLRWVLIHAGESVPKVPDVGVAKDKEKKMPGLGTHDDNITLVETADDIEAKAAIAVFPLEGTLEPHSAMPITFTFSPKKKPIAAGFKAHLQDPKSCIYKVLMQLRILNEEQREVSFGEDSIDFVLSGKACPIQPIASCKDIYFQPVFEGAAQDTCEATISIKNQGSELGLSYKLENLAQFHADPVKGTLGPEEASNIKIFFKPHQLGRFEKTMTIFFDSLEKEPKQTIEGSNNNVIILKKTNAPLHTIKLRLRGMMKPDTFRAFPPAAESNVLHEKSMTLWRSDIHVNLNTINNQWMDKTDNRKKYLEYLKSSQIHRLEDARKKRIGNDGVEVSYKTLLNEDWKVDRDNGLLAPEPTDFNPNDIQPKFEILANSDNTRIRQLLHQLMDMNFVPAPLTLLPTPEKSTAHLSVEDLNNLFASTTVLDFGSVTVYSKTTMPLKLLSLTSKDCIVDIQITSECENIEVYPSQISLNPMTVGGFSVSFNSSNQGPFSNKITYMINGRYRYQVFVKAEVRHLSLELNVKFLNLEVSATQLADIELQQGAVEVLHQTEEVIQVINTGNYPTVFEWVVEAPQNYTSHGMAVDGEFSVFPERGTVESMGKAEVKICYKAGIKSSSEKTLSMNIIDPVTQKVCDSLKLQCHGETCSAVCTILNSLKQGPLEIGVCPIGFHNGDKLHTLNVLGSQILIPPQQMQRPNTPSAKQFRETSSAGSARGYRTIKVKNTSVKACFFSALPVSNSPDVVLSQTSGVIPGGGGIIDIHIIVTPTECGIFEDEIHIYIIGGGKVLKVPIRYEGRKPDVVIRASKFGEFAKGTIIGTSAIAEVEIVNTGEIMARTIVDFRKHPEFKLMMKSITSNAASNVRTILSGSKKPTPVPSAHFSTALMTNRILSFGKGHEIYDFDTYAVSRRFSQIRKGQRNSMIVSNTKMDTESGILYIFDINPQETLVLNIEFKPLNEKRLHFSLPLNVIGSHVKSDAFIMAFGIKSPILLSKSFINFKNKVVLKDTGAFGVTHLKSIMKENTIITNNCERPIQWSFDLESLEEVDNVFKIDPFHGSLKPGASQVVVTSFHPESIGLFESRIPLHIDYMGRQAPFQLHLQGTGVEPSIAFDPPEIFLPISPMGQESSATFFIVNYGCERTEIKHFFFADTIKRHGHLDVQFPEGKLLKNDGEKLPVILRFVGNPTVCPEGSNDLAPSVKFASTTSGLADRKPLQKASMAQNLDDAADVESIVPPIYGSSLSFTVKLEFTDNVRVFFLPVHGTLDSSILSINGYLFAKRDNNTNLIEGPQGHLFLEEKKEKNLRDERHRRFVQIVQCHQSPGGLRLDNAEWVSQARAFLDQALTTTIKWVSEHVNLSLDAYNVPMVFSRNHGRGLLELVQSMSSKKKYLGSASISGITQTALAPERVKLLHRVYSDILTSLTAAGALLSSVKPEFLLTLEDFKICCSSRLEAMKSETSGSSVHDEFIENYRRLEVHFDIVSKEAWVTIFSQIIRIYSLQTITPKHFRSLPGVCKDEAELQWPIVSKGNIYSTGESILLRWASYHMWKRTGTLVRLTNFANDFKACIPISHLIIAHVPELEDVHFSNFNYSPANNEEREINIKQVNNALKELYKTNALSLPLKQILNAENQLEIVLLLLFLYQTLPQFIPKGVVQFHGALHEKITKHIEMENPSSRFLQYSAILTGSKEFQFTETSTVTLAPRGQAQIAVDFLSRFSRPSLGQLRLTSKKMGLNNSSILIFQLHATVESMEARRTYILDTQMYCCPATLIGVEVTNPFNYHGLFDVSLIQSNSHSPLLIPYKGLPDGELDYVELSDESKVVNPLAFRTNMKQITLEAFQTLTLPVAFQPFEPGHHKCTIHLIDESVGEFMYQVEGRVKIPQSIDLLWTCKAGNTLEKSIRVTPLNLARDKALQKVIHEENSKARHSTKSRHKELFQAFDHSKFQLPKQPLRYKVDYLSPFFSGPSELLLKTNVDTTRDKSRSFNMEQNYTELHVAFSPKAPGKYSCKVILTGLDVPDVRVFKIHGVAISEGSKADLSLKTPARQPLTQDIPIINRTEEDWTISATIEGSAFSGVPVTIAKSRQTSYYQLTFTPAKSGDYIGLLTLSNGQTYQKYIYSLRGCAQEPLPEDNREIKCVARETVSETFRVYNYTDWDAEYDVVTDLPNAKSESCISILANSYVDTVIEFRSIKVGSSVQIATFMNRIDQSYVWFILRLNVIPPPCVETINLKTFVRSAIAADLIIANPLEKVVHYTIQVEGEGVLAPSELEIEANSEKTYTITYAPLMSGQGKGSVVFSNNDVGEFWYEIQFEANEAPPVIIQAMSAPLGKCAAQPIFIENPTREYVSASLSVTNPQDFQLMYPPALNLKLVRRHRKGAAGSGHIQIDLKPLERAELQVIFWPSSLTETSCGAVIATSKQIGDFVFEVKGSGLMPEPMADVTVRSNLRKSTTSVISFTNPLVDPLTVTVKIAEEEVKGVSGGIHTLLTKGQLKVDHEFALMLNRKTKCTVVGLDTLDIPFTYTPQRMIGRAATIVVEVGMLRWMYPIMGLPDALVASTPKVYECRSRESIRSVHELILNEFNYDVEDSFQNKSVEAWANVIASEVEVLSATHITREQAKASINFELVDIKTLEDGLALKFLVPSFCYVK
ncbi:hypothetical protein BC830DRAFT_1106198 [Chytriomyces sp. MP71]|nr:hypothetical protein BC830DRAFT_1106198 [Chytriomyces sp. MP71]